MCGSASAAFFAYVFSHMALAQLDVICLSQLVGSPPMPEWNIMGMQFPSASMLDWNTGHGNAKYWALKLVIDHLPLGSSMFPANITQLTKRVAPRPVMCESIGHWTFSGTITFTCTDPNATLANIWADAGLPPNGQCGAYTPSSELSIHTFVTDWAMLQCKGKNSCTVDKTNVPIWPAYIKAFLDKIDPHSAQISLQFSCSSGMGVTSADYADGKSVYALGFAVANPLPGAPKQKLLLINKEVTEVDVNLSMLGVMRSNATAHIVDPRSVQRSSAQGIRTELWPVDPLGTKLTLQPYAVVIADLM